MVTTGTLKDQTRSLKQTFLAGDHPTDCSSHSDSQLSNCQSQLTPGDAQRSVLAEEAVTSWEWGRKKREEGKTIKATED